MVDKLYCFVDETGQDTKGKYFLVAIVIQSKTNISSAEQKLLEAEKKSKKNKLKWTKTPFEARESYLNKLISIKELKGAIYYSSYQETKEYIHLTAHTIAKAILTKEKDDFKVTIIIDGLNKKETFAVSRELKKLKIRYERIRGMKDEQNVFLRLADAVAGFIRDFEEKQLYTKSLYRKLREADCIIEA